MVWYHRRPGREPPNRVSRGRQYPRMLRRLGPAAVTVCKDDSGYDVDLAIAAGTRQMHRWLVGLVPFRDLIANGHARMLGPSRLARAFPTWFDTTYFAEGLHRAGQRHSRQAIPAQGLTA
jgi:hypothetical protein